MTSDHDSAPLDPPSEPDAELATDAPEADALEQRLPLDSAAEPGEELPLELPEGVNPADALEQALEVGGQDEYPADPDFADQ